MPKFRKKPVVIEAMKFSPPIFGDPDFSRQLKYAETFDDWLVENQGDRICKYSGDKLIIPTLEGDHEASDGDWIIRGVKGELYPCKPDIFEMTYEPAE